MSLCARPGCESAAKSSCSACDREQYCGSICQKLDWKIHKSICAILKKLPQKQQPYDEASRIINEILPSNRGKDARVLEHLLSYADYQFWPPITGRDYREWSDDQHISNWTVDIHIFYFVSAIPRRVSTSSVLSDIVKELSTIWLVYLESHHLIL
jgi:hypothetical protein